MNPKSILKFLIKSTKTKKIIGIRLKESPDKIRFVELYAVIKRKKLDETFKLSTNRFLIAYQIGGFSESIPVFGWKIINFNQIVEAKPALDYKLICSNYTKIGN